MTTKKIDVESVAGAYLALLADRGVDYLFANAGTDFAPIIEAMSRAGAAYPQPIAVAHENVAVCMAHGYAMITGRPQAVMLHVSVGTANGLCAIMNASRAQVPILFTAGRTPVTEEGMHGSRDVPIHWSQEMFDQAGMLREMVKWDYELRNAEQLETVVDRALNIAMSEPRGPVYLTLPREVIGTPVHGFEYHSPSQHQTPSSPHPDPAAIARAAAWLADAENPLIITTYLGRDEAAIAALSSLAARFALPVVYKWQRTMAIPSDHPMLVGFDPSPLIADSDVVVAVDSDVPWVPSYQPPATGAKTIHIGVDPIYSQYPIRAHRADLAITGVSAVALRMLEDALAAHESRIRDRVAARRARIAKYRAKLNDGWSRQLADAEHETPIHPAWLSHCIDRIKGEDAIVIKESPLALEHMRFSKPHTIFYGLGAGGLGWGQGAALGAKLARPDQLVICTQGDGAYQFSCPVAAHGVSRAYDLPVLTIIFNNAMWGAVRQATRSMYPAGHASRINDEPLTFLDGTPNLEKVVEAAGGYGERVENPAEVPGALERAMHVVTVERRSAVLNVVTRGPGVTFAGKAIV